MIGHKSLICAGVLTLLTTAPCFAMASWFPASGGNGHGGGQVSHSAPGPMLGVGLPALVVGGYFWYRRRFKQPRK
jgi:hypothetical protein